MESLPLHPVLVHLPLALAALLPLLSAGLLVAWWRDWLPRRTWVLVALAQAALLVGGLASQRSGEEDEERVEHVVPEAALEAHEEAAETFVLASGVVLVLALAPFVLADPRRARLAALGTVAGSLVVLGLGVRVGEAGGELVYRHGAGAVHASPVAAAASPVLRGGHEHEDDD